MKFRSDELRELLRGQTGNAFECSKEAPTPCDVSYALFLEPPDTPDPTWTLPEKIAAKAIELFSPSPVMAHCELLTPPIPDSRGGKVSFATYLGAKAGWQNRGSPEEAIDFYLVRSGTRWRALPVFGPNAADSVRSAASANINSPYSVSMYATSAPPLRVFSGFISDLPGHSGHCATITSRILREAGVGSALKHRSPWYSPSSLYNDLVVAVGAPLATSELKSIDSLTPDPEVATTIEELLRGKLSYATVRDLGDERCIAAIRHLTLRVCATARGASDETRRAAQKELATGLLRWSLLREDSAE